MNYKARLRALLAAIDQQKLDALLVTHLPNVRYLCGFTGSAGVLVVAKRGVRLFTDGRYTEQARKEVAIAAITISRQSPIPAAAEWLNKAFSPRPNIRVGIDGEHMAVSTHTRLAKLVRKRLRLVQAPALVEQARMIKDADEIDLLRRAANLGSSLFDIFLRRIRPGVRETEVAAAVELRARQKGAQGMSFETIVASGERSAMPHGTASQRPIPKRGFVVCDFGVILAGYCSDMTRTVYVGRPPAEARSLYQAVLDAQGAAVQAVRPGIVVAEVDRQARKVLQKAGLGRYFSHSTGHGVGLEIHEPPRVASGDTAVLKPGMVITIEPGAYVPGRWGVRIEDMVVVTERGCDVLTSTPKELIAI
jgi:Xaa-Pro aminopeptidase